MNLKKKSFLGLFLFRWSKIKVKTFIKLITVIVIFLFSLIILTCWEIYIPKKPWSRETIIYIVQKGQSDEDIAKDLEKQGIINSDYFFRAYAVFSFQHSKLQAGRYVLGPGMSVYEIVKKLVNGDVIKEKITIIEGWDIKDAAEYFEGKNICGKDDFIILVSQDYSKEFGFLTEKPKNVNLEGYLFPDTYEISQGESCEDILKNIIANFEKKITLELKEAIASRKKSIFEIMTMASIIEKEVKTMNDKEIVSGLLWKRLEAGMPLQVDATINYITGKNQKSALLADTKIDSLYNTYKYKGLPLGPISNPGMDSILAAIYPKASPYWYYLSGVDGKTIFSQTLKEHNIARVKYLK
ncbi:MAG: UPF0755 protein [Parcubacteria group bacterium Licking1014_1]|nr:MAG: UPF0755 protein [Parcubacteria group bacterium Licking1014_1]